MFALFSKYKTEEAKLILSSRLFDADFYRTTCDVKSSAAAVQHYIQEGWKLGMNPSVYFDGAWYLQRYDDVKRADMCPLVHFLRYGSSENRTTSPFFNIDRMKSKAESSLSGEHPVTAYLDNPLSFRKDAIELFDRDFYLSKAAQSSMVVEGDPFRHFMMHGWRQGLDPHPLFSTTFYLQSYPDVRESGSNPLAHYLKSGGAELRQPHPRFDVGYYIKQSSDWTRFPDRNPLVHFLDVGVKTGANPNPDFDVSYYLYQHPDVRQDGINPFVHFLLHGEDEGRSSVHPINNRRNREEAIAGTTSILGASYFEMPALSVVIPTYNRRRVLESTLQRCFELPGSDALQFIVVNDGSTDDTLEFLNNAARSNKNLEVIHIENGGPGAARNRGAAIAKNDIILFMGDDVVPTSQDFFTAHQDFHRKRASLSDAMVGKVVWPSGKKMQITAVMRHIQGRGGEQFGFADLTPYTWLDWRFFYTSNISVKKQVVLNWEVDGFSHEFKLYGFEDIEFAYRLANNETGLKILYDPLSEGEHVHTYNFEQFVQRQLNTGRMARTFLDKHPTATHALGLADINLALASTEQLFQRDSADILSMFEGLKAWVNYLERHELLGNSGFHDDLMGAFFELSFLVGFVNAARDPSENIGAALNVTFSSFMSRMRRSLRNEVTAHDNIFPLPL